MKKSKLELPIVSLLENGCIEQSQVLNGYAKVGREASLQYIVLEEDSNVEQNYIFILM